MAFKKASHHLERDIYQGRELDQKTMSADATTDGQYGVVSVLNRSPITGSVLLIVAAFCAYRTLKSLAE
jgi:hypothetical protein